QKHRLDRDPALVLLAKIVNGADTDNSLWKQPESAGLNAIAEGLRHLGLKGDHGILAAEAILYDALYAYCPEMVRRCKPDGQFKCPPPPGRARPLAFIRAQTRRMAAERRATRVSFVSGLTERRNLFG